MALSFHSICPSPLPRLSVSGSLSCQWGCQFLAHSVFSTIVDRKVLTPLFYEDPTKLPTHPSVPNFVLTPAPHLPCCLVTCLSLVFLLSCFCWMDDCTIFDKLFYLMIFWLNTCQSLVPKYQKGLDVCFMQ